MTSKIILFMVLFVGIVGCRNQKEMEPIDLAELTIGDIHGAYEEGRFTAEQLTRAYLSRIAEFDEQINSITTINSEAISIAKQLDAEYQKTGKLRPLHGITNPQELSFLKRSIKETTIKLFQRIQASLLLLCLWDIRVAICRQGFNFWEGCLTNQL